MHHIFKNIARTSRQAVGDCVIPVFENVFYTVGGGEDFIFDKLFAEHAIVLDEIYPPVGVQVVQIVVVQGAVGVGDVNGEALVHPRTSSIGKDNVSDCAVVGGVLDPAVFLLRKD